jgi:hypothetical protein
MSSFRWRGLPGLAVLVLACIGCGAKEVRVTGSLLKDGKPMIVSKDTYVTISFIPAATPSKKDGSPPNSYSATFVQDKGTYSVTVAPGTYRTKLIIVPPAAPGGKISAPPRPIDSDKTYELTKNQELNLEVPAK